MKKLPLILIVMFAVFLGHAYSKNANENKKESKARIPPIVYQDNVDPNSVLSVSRSGEVVTLRWNVDFSACRLIDIARNTTGLGHTRNMYHAARIQPPNVQQHEDIVPGASHYYYWIRVILPTGAPKEFGPVRVGPDKENIGNYTNIAEVYPWTLSRTASTVAISWKFPDRKYQRILIKRGTLNGPRQDVHATLEWEGAFVDNLPDPEAEYMYWMQAYLENGAIIHQGPVKAE
jgi:hypothetical protein